MKKIFYAILCLFLCLFAAAFIIYPDRYINICFQGLSLWAECVLPSLFPFAVLSLLAACSGVMERASLPLKRVTSLFNLPPTAAACFLISVFSGYPTGAKTVQQLYSLGSITKSDAEKMSYFCSTSGPMFLIGTIGVKGYGDQMLGIYILLAHIFSVLIVGLLLCKLKAKTPTYMPTKAKISDKNLVFTVFTGAVNSMLLAGGFIVFFYVAAQFAVDFSIMFPLEFLLQPIFKERASLICAGLIEATGSCLSLARTGSSSIPICGFLLTFGGASILMQQLAFLKDARISGKKFIFVKFIQAIFCYLILLIFFH